MQKSKMILLILVAILMAFGASFLANNIMSNKLSNNTEGLHDNLVSVVVAATDIAYGQVLEKENLILKELPKQLVTVDSFSHIEDTLGKIAKGEIYQGEAIVSKRITDRNEGTILAALVNQDMRAVSVRVDDVIGVAGFLLPGNRVDVLASRMDKHRSLTRTILQNIKVLAVDQTAEASKDKPLLVRAVTMEVSPQDSEKLFQAVQEGSIHLTLRNPIDSSTAILAKKPAEPIPPQKTTIKKNAVRKKKKNKPKLRKRAKKAKAVKKEISNTANNIQPIVKVLPTPSPKLKSTITVIRGITQNEITMTKKGVP